MKISRDSYMLYLVMFIMGSCGIAYEYTFSKISSDLLGNSARQWAIIIGLMMFFMGIGSDYQKRISNKNLIDKFIFFEVLLAIAGGFGPVLMMFVFGYARDYFILVQYFFIVTIGFLIGLEIPLLTRANENYTKELKFNLGDILKMDYIGSFVGALLWVFFLPIYFTMIETSFVLAILNIVVALLSVIYFYKMIYRKKTLLIGITVILIALIYGFLNAEDWRLYAEQNLFKDKVVFSETTKYQHIVVTESSTSEIFCYINGNLQFSSIDEHIYHEMLVHPAIASAHKRDRVLILGGGDGLALREILKYDDVKEITLVDIDPEMTKLAAENPLFTELNNNSLSSKRVNISKNSGITSDEKVLLEIPDRNSSIREQYGEAAVINLYNIDAYRFLQNAEGLFDVIIIDFPDPSSIELSKLYSKGFYTMLHKKLSRYGTIVQQSTSPYHAKETFLCIGRTMESAGFSCVPYHQNVPTFGEWGFWIGKRSDVFNENDIIEKLNNLSIIDDVRFVTPEIISSSLIFGKGILDTKNSDINTITTNSIFKYYSKAWQNN